MEISTMTRFAKHLGAYSASEVAAKLSRLAVVLVIARMMTPEAIGLVAAAMAASDLFKAFTENGVTQRIIRASDSELSATCRRARAIYWVWCAGLFVVQVAFAIAFEAFTGNGMIAAMIALLAVEYLFMPGGLVNCALAMREGRMSATAAIAGGQIVGANLATAALVLIWPSPFAIILPKVLSAVIWLIAMRRLRPWTQDATPTANLRPFIGFGAAILGGEILKATRLQADKLIVGGLLGAEALGIWFFAINAGLGLANSFGSAFGTVLFPNLCASHEPVRVLRRTLGMALCVLAPVIILQSLLAPFYVPLIFGAKWADISTLVSILCMAAIPNLIWSACAQFLRAGDRAGTELSLNCMQAIAVVGVTAVLAPFGLEAIAWGTLGAAIVLQLGASLIALLPSLSTFRKEPA